MKIGFSLLLLVCYLFADSTRQENICLNTEEQELYDLLMTYRKQKGLPEIPLSYSLTKVAKLHTYDLQVNGAADKSRCNLHSWSNKGQWTACCYTGDQKSAECMWNKPRELTKYQGDGFEISAWLTDLTPKRALDGWKKSSGHNQVMINKGTWKKLEWNAVGISISGPYTVIWFGTEKDTETTEVVLCE